MSNKLKTTPKDTESVKKDKFGDFFSSNKLTDKIYKVYINKDKLEATKKRHGVNSIISNVIVCVIMLALAITYHLSTAAIALILYGVITAAIGVWGIYKGENKVIQIVNIAISSISVFAAILSLL